MNRLNASWFVVASLLVPALAPTLASAQEKPRTSSSDSNADSRALAETLFFAARGLMDAGRLPEACAKFAESYRLDPAAGTLLNLAVCHEREGRIATAWGEFREARADARKSNRPDREELSSARIAAIEPDLPYLTIVVPPSVRVPGLEIKRNTVGLTEAAWGTKLPVDPGEVTLVASAPGYNPSTAKIVIDKREQKSVTIAPLQLAPKTLVATRSTWSTRKTGGFITLIGGGVGIVGAGVLGLLAANQKSKSDDQCPVFDGERRCTAAGSSAMSNARGLAWGADGAFAVGVIGVAVGSYFFFSSGNKEAPARAASPGPHVALDVNVVPGSAYAGMRGTF